jgi:single-strand DNA-binding protein
LGGNMVDVNSVAFSGRLTRDMELKQSGGGAYGRFSIAVNSAKKVGEQWQEEVSYFDCILFGQRCEKLQLTKGTQVFISGSIKQSRYEKENGEKKSSVLVLVDRIVVVNSGSEHSDDYGDIPF